MHDINVIKSKFSFPCIFPIKIIGISNRKVEKFILQILKNNLYKKNNLQINTQNIQKNNYISVTVLFTANNEDELIKVYQKLKENSDIKIII